MGVVNPFRIESEAARYHRYRPRYHHLPLKQIRDLVGKDFESALDVACGTGHSTVEISKISKRTFGCDASESMLSEARKHPGIEFVWANAEDLPFESASFDFINTSMGFHWFDQEKFLQEAKRVLKKGGYLAIDSYGFSGKVSDDAEKQKLHSDFMQENLPRVSRSPSYPTDELIEKAKFSLAKEIKYQEELELDSDEFSNLLMTWSNFQILDDARKEAVIDKMKSVYEAVFEGKRLSLLFAGKTLLYRSQ